VRSFLPIHARLWSAALLLALAAPAAGAQGTAPVPPNDLAYRDLDRLAELGVFDSVIFGQRPYSRREIGRIISLARAQLDRVDNVLHGGQTMSDAAAFEANGIVQRLITRFNEETESRPFDGPELTVLDGLAVTFNSTDAVRRGFPASHTRRTEATIDPLARRRLGEPAVRGNVTSVELSQRLEAASWLSFHARERLEYRARRDTGVTKTKGELLLAGMRLRAGNVALMVGREQLAWGQSAGDGLFLASDAPALDQISLSGDHPFTLPGFLRVLGPTQATLVLADLGPSLIRSHSKLLAYKVSVHPHPAFELGGTFMNHYGGQGARSSTFSDRLIDFMPFIDVFRRHNYTDTSRTLDVDSDKLLGVDARLRLARLGGLLLTGEVLIDDFDVHRIPFLFTGYGSSQIGITIPEIGTSALSMKLSAKHMGIITYTHGELANGITTRGRLLGDELGPDAKAFGAELRWIPSASLRMSVAAWSTQYSNAEYVTYYADPAQTQFVVRKATTHPEELRDRFVGTFEFLSEEGLALVVRGGTERIRNTNFQGYKSQPYMVDVALRLQR
jgi:hypothetical protein